MRPGRLDRLGEPGQPVAAGDQHVGDAAVAELGEHPGPELGALGGLDPDPEHMLDPVAVDADGDVGGLVADLVVVADLHHQRVQIQDRVDRLQRPGLPGLHLLRDRVGDVGDRLVAELGAQGAFQMGLDVADRHPTRIEADDHVRQPADPALTLRHQPRVEGAVPVPRGGQLQITDLGAQPFTRRPVPGVPRPAPRRIVLLIAQMPGQLSLQTGLQHPLHQLRQKPALPGQLDPTLIDPVHQLVQETLIKKPIDRLLRRPLRAVRPRHTVHPEPRFLRSVYTENLIPPKKQSLEANVDTDLDTLATALYVVTDDLLASHPERVPPRPAVCIAPRISDAELCTLAVLQALLCFTSEHRWLRYAHRHLLGMFPDLPQQSGYNKRLRRLADTMAWLVGRLGAATSIGDDTVWVVDSTPVE